MTARERPLVMARWNLLLRFALEFAALVGLGVLGWHAADGLWRVIPAVVFPVAAAVVWGAFNVPGDPSRSGRAPIRVDGRFRLGVELAIFGLGAWGLWRLSAAAGVAVVSFVLVHHAASWPRVVWLLGGARPR